MGKKQVKKASKSFNLSFDFWSVNASAVRDFGFLEASILAIINLLEHNPKKWSGYLPISELMKFFGLKSNKAILNALHDLEAKKAITIDQRKGNRDFRYWNELRLTKEAKKKYVLEYKPKVIFIRESASKKDAVKPSWYSKYKNDIDIKEVNSDISEAEMLEIMKDMF